MGLIRNKTPGCSGLQLAALLSPDLHVYDEADCILLSISIQPSPTPTGCLHNRMTIAYQFDRERGLSQMYQMGHIEHNGQGYACLLSSGLINKFLTISRR